MLIQVYYAPDTSNVTATAQALEGCTVLAGAENAVFASQFYSKTESLPRQARDKHRENSKETRGFSAGIRSVAPVNAKGKYLVGEFELPGGEGRRAMLLQNQDEEHVLWSTLFFTLKASAPQVRVREMPHWSPPPPWVSFMKTIQWFVKTGSGRTHGRLTRSMAAMHAATSAGGRPDPWGE